MENVENGDKRALEAMNRESTSEVKKTPLQSVDQFFEKYPHAETLSENAVEKMANESGLETALGYVLEQEAALKEQVRDWNQSLPNTLGASYPSDLAPLTDRDRHILLDSGSEEMFAKIFTRLGEDPVRSAERSADLISRLSTIAVAAETINHLKDRLQEALTQRDENKKATVRNEIM